jgi:hypothetical protein
MKELDVGVRISIAWPDHAQGGLIGNEFNTYQVARLCGT